MKLVAIAGGIGTGKSVVSHVLHVMGYPVYDCDTEARRLMNEDESLVVGIKLLLGDESYSSNGVLNRDYVSQRMFADGGLVQQMNSLVHPIVLCDIVKWAHTTGSKLNFVETALLKESNMTSIVDDVWQVTAPLQVRIERVMRRNNLTEAQVRARMEHQSSQNAFTNHVIVNDNEHPILPQVVALLSDL